MKSRDTWLRDLVMRHVRLRGERSGREAVSQLDAIVRLIRAIYELDDGSGLAPHHLRDLALAVGLDALQAGRFAEEVREGLKQDPLYRNPAIPPGADPFSEK